MPRPRLQNLSQPRLAHTHSHSQCYEDTLVAYEFNKKNKYPPYCYPRGLQGEEDVQYGNVTNAEEVFDYQMTLEPKFYTERARCRYYPDTYAEPEKDKKQLERVEPMTEADDIYYEETDKTLEEAFKDLLNQPITTDYGPPARQNLVSFDAPEVNTNLPESTDSDADVNRRKSKSEIQPSENATPPTPKPRKGVSKKKAETQPHVEKQTIDTKDDNQTAAKRKLVTNSPQASSKKTKHIKQGHQDCTKQIKDVQTNKDTNVTKIIINGKACVQRNFDFSAGQPRSRIPVGSQVRVGRSPGNPGPAGVKARTTIKVEVRA